MIWALYSLARRYWSREAGLLAVALWVTLPFIASFSILTDAMFPAMACSIVTCRAFLEWLERPSRRWLAIALLAQAVAGLLFWEAYFQAVLHAAMALVWARRTGRRREALGWILATGALATAEMGFHLAFLRHMGMWDDFFASFKERRGAAFGWVIERQAQWLWILYGLPLVAVGIAWLARLAMRLSRGEARLRDLAPFTFFAINVLYIAAFSEGASLHLYRVFWFSSFLVLAAVDLFGEARGARPRVAIAALALLLVADAGHAGANLLESRVMMGTHGLAGYDADYPKQLFAQEVARRTAPDDFVFIHDDVPRRVEFWYYLDRSNQGLHTVLHLDGEAAKHPRAVFLTSANPSLAERKLDYRQLRRHPGAVFDRYLMIDLRSAQPGFREYRFEAERPSWAWRWFVSHRYPPMHAVETATIRSACVAAATGVAPPGDAPPVPAPDFTRPEQVACYHNYLRVRGQPEAAARYLEGFARQTGAVDAALPFGRAVALRASGGAVELWARVEAPGPLPPRARFLVERTAQDRRPLRHGLGRGASLRPAPLAESHRPVVPVPVEELTEATLAEVRAGDLWGARLGKKLPRGHYRLWYEPGFPQPSYAVGEFALE